MKEKFKKINFDGSIRINLGERGLWECDKRELLNNVVDICEEYQNNGDTLTLRQLYYQLVSKDAVPNHDKVYKKISSIKDELVYGGFVDWSVFEDRGRVPIEAYYEDGIKEALRRTINCYALDRQQGQRNIVEVWTEKDAISGILKRVTNPFGVKLVVNKGYTSSTAIYGAYERFIEELEQGKKITILYFGDHDPSGIDMIRDIRERLYFMFTKGERQNQLEEIINDWAYEQHPEGEEGETTIKDEVWNKYWKDSDCAMDDDEDYTDFTKAFFKENFKVIPIGLTMEQIRLYNPPPNPAKITDPRAKEYIRKFGKVSWEVDAIKPKLMREIVRDAILYNIDEETYEAVLLKEKNDVSEITKMIKSIKD